MVQDPSSLRTEQTISTTSGQWVTRKIKYVHLNYKACEVYRPVWCSISAHIDHIYCHFTPSEGLSMIPRVGTCSKLAAKMGCLEWE